MDGFDLRAAPLIERKRVLQSFLAEAKSVRIIYSEHLEGNGEQIFKQACKLKYEGIVSKRRNAPYRSGRSGAWEKVKCVTRGTFPIIGFVPAQPRSLAALYLARRDGKTLRYAGKVGTGFTNEEAHKLRTRLEMIVTDKPPVAGLRKPKARWVLPKFEADIDYREVSGDGSLRHPSFKGIK